MKRAIPGLLLVLLIQLGLMALVYWPGPNPGGVTATSTLPALDPARVDTITISDAQGAQARMEKVGDHWRLTTTYNLPANAEQVEKLLQALLSPGNDWPIASSAAARQRFEVADYRFRRRIELLAGDNFLQTVYLGTSPGFRKVYSRVAGQDNIRSLTFNVHDAPASDSAWIDPRLLQVRTPMRIDADAYSVQREGGEWQSGTGGTPDERELLALLTALRTLQIKGMADLQTTQDLEQLEASLVMEIDSLGGLLELSLFQREGQYFIRSSEFPMAFVISAYDFDRITGIDFLLISGDGPDRGL